MQGDLQEKIIGAALEVHRLLGGPGLIENVYESALCHELSLRGVSYQRQLPIPVIYKGITIREPLFLDVLVESEIVVEVKASGKDYPYYYNQLSTHLRLLGLKSGLLINFGKPCLVREGISRILNEQLLEGS